MKKLLGVAGVLLTVLVGLTFAAPANAAPAKAPSSAITSSTSAPTASGGVAPAQMMVPLTGNYYYVCVLTSGNSWSLTPGENLTDCKGSYLQKYLDGRQIARWSLTQNGTPATNRPPSEGCLVAIGLAGAGLVFSPPTGGVSWFAASAIAAAGIGYSCKA